jgi:transposase
MIIFNKLVEMKKRKKYTSGFKTKVVLEALQERDTIQELAKKYDLHPTQISTWKSQFLMSASSVFEKGVVKGDDEKEKTELFKKVGQLQMEVDFLKKVLGK